MDEEDKLKRLKNEIEVWNVINKRREKKEWRHNSISKEEWRKYFMEL